MRSHSISALCILSFLCGTPVYSQNSVKLVRDAISRSTLNQKGTKPFHLKATLTPSSKRDDAAHLTGQVEIWWDSPTLWKREVTSPEFHQIQIVDGDKHWQKSEGAYFPGWLQEISNELINPAPLSDDLLQTVKNAEVRHLFGTTYFSWTLLSSDGIVEKGEGAGISVTDESGLLFTANGFGWNGLFHDYKDFHGRMVARTVASGSPEVTAHVAILEDFKDISPDFFAPNGPGWDANSLQTIPISEADLRKNLIAAAPPVWPDIADGPIHGVLTTELVVDREGDVHELGTIVSDNPKVNDTAAAWIKSAHFQPFLVNGMPTQVLSRITLAFNTKRPDQAEAFDTALNIFNHARQADFLAARASYSYALQATFKMAVASGHVTDGTYTDTWQTAGQWRREAHIAGSQYVRTRNGEKFYELSDGADATKAKLILRAMEPIPDTSGAWAESDWRIKRDTVNGQNLIRVATGYESSDGKLDPNARAYWFDDKNNLIKAHFSGIEIIRSGFEHYNDAEIAHDIDIMVGDKVAAHILVTGITASLDPKVQFKLSGHDSPHTFTDEVR